MSRSQRRQLFTKYYYSDEMKKGTYTMPVEMMGVTYAVV
jgi:hypothetical protein